MVRFRRKSGGFTLIELSIVLVIIGLIVGGVLVGRDLIATASVRAQISQIEKYQQAVNTFRGKYNSIPGDLAADGAATFNFLPRSAFPNGGNNNGLIEGYVAGASNGLRQDAETLTFWEDLATANLISESFTTYTPSNWNLPSPVSATGLKNYIPSGKIGANFVYVWSGGSSGADNNNYFGISVSTVFDTSGFMASNLGLTVQQAFLIDRKVDDGLPQSGNVIAIYVMGTNFIGGDWASRAASGSATTCHDQGGNAVNPWQYSMTQNNGGGMNCALSFKFQ